MLIEVGDERTLLARLVPMSQSYKSVYGVGRDTQLFVDDHLIAERHGLIRRMHQPKKHPGNPLMLPTLPFERDYQYHYTWDNGSVILDPRDGVFRAYWSQAQKHVLYAWSDDGITWRKPELGRASYADADQNNILVEDTHAATVTYNPHLRERPYRMFAKGRHKLQQSADGLHWEDVESDMRWGGKSDSGACVYDRFNDRYIMVQKRRYPIGARVTHPLTAEPWEIPIRVLGITTSGDALQWSDWTEVLRPDETDHQSVAERYPAVFVEGFLLPWRMREEFRAAHELAERTRFLDRLTLPPQHGFHHMDLMNMIVIPYHGLYIGLLQVCNSTAQAIDFGASGKPRPDSPGQDGTMEVQLACSRDLTHWERLGEREPFLPLGAVDEWDRSMLMPFTSNPIVRDGKMWLYYGGSHHSHRPNKMWNKPSDYPDEWQAFGLATLRRDGFVSLSASSEGGTLTTRPLAFDGRTLTVNVDAAKGGALRVELQDPAGAPIPGHTLDECDPVTSDALDHPVAWGDKADLTALAKRPVRLHFEMHRAALYAFTFSL